VLVLLVLLLLLVLGEKERKALIDQFWTIRLDHQIGRAAAQPSLQIRQPMAARRALSFALTASTSTDEGLATWGFFLSFSTNRCPRSFLGRASTPITWAPGKWDKKLLAKTDDVYALSARERAQGSLAIYLYEMLYISLPL
jgi:hypothetical protein